MSLRVGFDRGDILTHYRAILYNMYPPPNRANRNNMNEILEPNLLETEPNRTSRNRSKPWEPNEPQEPEPQEPKRT